MNFFTALNIILLKRKIKVMTTVSFYGILKGMGLCPATTISIITITPFGV
ncbi:MAG: hypothetical protein KKC03_00655 [Bacteroidetes bacterium]|nr:hypothetical protein [Bacteroidota bacterium]